MKQNMVGWFEIPVTDMDRAKKFYETVFKLKISIHDMGGLVMGWFPNAEDTKGQCLERKQLQKVWKQVLVAKE